MAKKKSLIPKSKAKTAYGLLSDVRRAILDEPLRYDQGCFINRRGDDAVNKFPIGKNRNVWPACGTVACIAGWALLLKGRSFTYQSAPDQARAVLGLDQWQSSALFSPQPFGPDQTIEHAESGAAHIRRFQRKYAQQLKAQAIR